MIRKTFAQLIYPARINLIKNQLNSFAKPYKLHVGCGQIRLPGWINIDYLSNPGITDVVWDVSQGFSFLPDASCGLIYSEHFLEHLAIEQGCLFLSECQRILQPDGVVRIAMPSLEYAVNKYQSVDWKEQDWLTWKEHQFIQTPAEMLNVAMRWWGHQWLYDQQELYRRLRDAGFSIMRNMAWGESEISELRNLETRPDSLLICEAQKS